MSKIRILFVMMVILALLAAGCSAKPNSYAAAVDKLNIQVEELKRENEQLKRQLETNNDVSTPKPAPKPATVNFTNKFGTPTTKCAHAGCNNYIASSGDSNCCTTHSEKCAECNAYIDEDAILCLACIVEAFEQ